VRQFYGPAIAATSDGEHGAILGWAASTGADLNVHATRVAQDGSIPWERDRVLCEAPGEQSSVACASASPVGAVFAWRDGRAAEAVSIRAQLVSRRGRISWAPGGAIVADGPGDRGPMAIVSDGRNSYYFVWVDPRLGGRLFAQRLLNNEHHSPLWPRSGVLVSTRASSDPISSTQLLELVPATPGAAIAAWNDQIAGSLAMLLTPHGPAAAPAAPTPMPTATAASVSGPAVSLSILAVTPDPVFGAASLRFVLPTGASTSLELIDLAGRRIWSRDLGPLDAGEHVTPLADGTSLPTGVYFARLTHGRRTVMRRVVVLK
jgi:hypothetical protein